MRFTVWYPAVPVEGVIFKSEKATERMEYHDRCAQPSEAAEEVIFEPPRRSQNEWYRRLCAPSWGRRRSDFRASRRSQNEWYQRLCAPSWPQKEWFSRLEMLQCGNHITAFPRGDKYRQTVSHNESKGTTLWLNTSVRMLQHYFVFVFLKLLRLVWSTTVEQKSSSVWKT